MQVDLTSSRIGDGDGGRRPVPKKAVISEPAQDHPNGLHLRQ